MKNPLLSALVFLLCACARDTRLGTLDALYQTPSLPLHFRTPEDRTAFSLSASANDQGAIRHHRTYRERSDGSSLFLSRDSSNTHPYADVEERYRLERAAYALGASIVWQQDILYSGLAAGLDPEHPEGYHAGAFAGFSGGRGRLIFSLGAGVFRARIRRDVRYWNYVAIPILDTLLPGRGSRDSVYGPASASGWKTDWELRFAAGARFQAARRWAPYLAAEWGTARFWYPPSEGTDDRWLGDFTFGGGLEWRPAGSFPVRLELRSGHAITAEGRQGSFIQAGLRLEKEW